MNALFKQDGRLGRLTTSLGKDVLVLLRFDGSDCMNDLFEYRVQALAENVDIDFDALVGTHATVEIEGHQGPRQFDGIVTQTQKTVTVRSDRYAFQRQGSRSSTSVIL